MTICWEILSRQLFIVLILNAVLVVLVPLPFGVWGGMWNSIVSVPDHCLFVYFSQSTQAQGRRGFLKVVRPWDGESVPRLPKARDGESTRGVFPSLVKGFRGISKDKILGSERL